MEKTVKTKERTVKKSIKRLIKENKKLAFGIAMIAILLIVFLGYRVWLNIHFLLTDDLVLNLEPQGKSFSIHYEEKPTITISVGIENSFVCNAFCSYEFKDLSTQSTVDKGSFTSKGIGKKFSKDFQLSADKIGTGQKIYTFEIECNNIRNFYCLSNEVKRKKSTFITLNYDLSEYEKILKETLKNNITNIIDELNSADIGIQNINKRFFELGFLINLNEMEKDKEILNNYYDKIILELKGIERIWSEQNYLLLEDLFNKSYDSRILDINNKIADINSKINETIGMHNSFIEEINNAEEDLIGLNSTVIFLSRQDKEYINDYEKLLNKTLEAKSLMRENSFVDYEFIEREVDFIKNEISKTKEDSKNIFRDLYLKGAYFDSLEKSKLCSIKGICLNKTNFDEAIENSVDIDDDKISNLCLNLESIDQNYKNENNRSDELLKNYDINEINSTIENIKKIKTLIEAKKIYDEIRGIKASNDFNDSLNLLLNISSVNATDDNIDYGNISESEANSLIRLELSDNAEKYHNNYCRAYGLNISKYGRVELNEVANVEDGNFSSRIDIKLTENYPVCCVFGECRKCCTENECAQDSSLYPVLFLHGHAFNSDNNPDYSLDAFNKIQSKLQEEGYISAGTITPTSGYGEISKNEWGLSSRPITVKGSYYLVSYYNLGSYAVSTQKSENIETYAIRLKELIDLLKFRTGRDKVVIVSHSMGSLVARSYMQIFGDNDIDKLIMIAAPSNGISGQVNSYCPIFGEKKECNDMNENSIFVKKINDPNKIPKNAKVFNIVGTGCDTDGEEGDGIVRKRNSEIEFGRNYYINGTCSGFSDLLHTKILDIEKYPEVYLTITSILKQ